MANTGEKAKILIISDDSDTYGLLSSSLKACGYLTLEQAMTRDSAIQLAVDEKPDLVLIEAAFNGGGESAERILEQIHTQIIYITECTDREALCRLRPTTPFGYINKSFLDHQLENTIEMALHVGRVEAKLKETEANLRESERKYNQLFHNAPTGIYDIDFVQNRVTDVNDVACHITGYSRDEILNMSPFDFLSSDSKREFVKRLEAYKHGEEVADSVEYEIITKNGDSIWVLLSGSYKYMDGRVIGASVVAHDISEIKMTKRDLEESKIRFSQFFENLGSGVAVYQALDGGKDFVFKAFNPAAEKITKISREYAIGNSLLDRFPNMEKSGLVSALRRVWKSGREEHLEPFYYKDNVREGWRENYIFKLPSGEVVALFDDVTDKMLAEEALRESEEKFRSFSEYSIAGQYLIQDNYFKYVNPKFAEIFGYTVEEIVDKLPLNELVFYEDLDLVNDEIYKRISGQKKVSHYSFRGKKKSGRIIEVEIYGSSMTYLGRPASIGTILDITERKKAEAALRKSEERFRLAFDTSPDAISIIRLEDGLYVDINEGFVQQTGFARKDVIGEKSREIKIWHNLDDREHLIKELEKKGYYDNLEAKLRRKDGSITTALISARIIDLYGIPHIISIIRDISERKIAEKLLKESEERYRTTFESIPDIVTITRVEDGLYFYVNETFCEITGYSKEEAIGRTPQDINLYTDFNVRKQMMHELRENGRLLNFEVKFRKKDGSFFDSLFSAKPIRIENKDCLVALTKDITNQKKLEEEKKRLEEQLKQSQKMEAVGTLAGGIAHDFNNLLQAISGYTQLLLMDKIVSDPDYRSLKEIFKSANRASDLIRQLLLFSRKADSVRKPVALDREVENARKILERTIPKMVDIKVHTMGRLWSTLADPIQIEQILLNLGVNAADAMPEGGSLIIETENVCLDEAYCQNHLGAQPGNYVLLTVSDTGHGISYETKEKIFEPFFTTKEFGKGTGLGLASVYGIVKSHGGYITCYSEIGMGTNFKIYLPAVHTCDDDSNAHISSAPPKGGNETILLVDDEKSIRDFASQVLKKLYLFRG